MQVGEVQRGVGVQLPMPLQARGEFIAIVGIAPLQVGVVHEAIALVLLHRHAPGGIEQRQRPGAVKPSEPVP